MRVTRRPGSSVYQVTFKFHGALVRRSTGERDRARALEVARCVYAEVVQAGPRPSRERGRLSELAALDLKRAEDGGTTTAHSKALASLWRVVLREIPPDTHVADIDWDLVQGYVGRRRGRGVRGQTIRREVAALRRAAAIAKRKGWLSAIPEWPEVKSDTTHPTRRGRLVPPDKLAAFVAHLVATDPELAEVVVFDVLTGLRRGELERVEASWVRPAPAAWKLRHLLVVPASAAKNRKERTVGLPEPALLALERRVARLGKSGALFPHADRRKSLAKACRLVGIPRLHWRDLRHSFATIAGEEIPPADVQAALGHSDLKTTNRYLSSILLRAASAGDVVAGAIARHEGRGSHVVVTVASAVQSKVPESSSTPGPSVERETRLELATLSLGSVVRDSSCCYCCSQRCWTMSVLAHAYEEAGTQSGATVDGELDQAPSGFPAAIRKAA